MVAKLILNKQGVRELLTGTGVQADLRKRAERVKAAAGDGHEIDVSVGTVRARASVFTATADAARREARTRSLTRAIDAAR